MPLFILPTSFVCEEEKLIIFQEHWHDMISSMNVYKKTLKMLEMLKWSIWLGSKVGRGVLFIEHCSNGHCTVAHCTLDIAHYTESDPKGARALATTSQGAL